jgi:hypothetical protein
VTRGRVSWKIISGTGKYATLRGNDTYTGEIIGGDPSDPISVIYRTTWTGMVEFDATPPVVGVAATATRLKQPAGAYSVRISLVVRNEEPGSRIAYRVVVRAGSFFVPGGSKRGATTSGRAVLTLRVKPPRSARTVQVIVKASDPIGNESTTTGLLKLR